MPRDLRTLKGQGRRKGNTCPPNRRIPGASLHSLVGQRRERGQRCDPTINEFNRVNRALRREDRREDRALDEELERLLGLVREDDPSLSNQDLRDLGLEDMIEVRKEKPRFDDIVILDDVFFDLSSEEEEKGDEPDGEDEELKKRMLDEIISLMVENQHLITHKEYAKAIVRYMRFGRIDNLGVVIKKLRENIGFLEISDLRGMMDKIRNLVRRKRPREAQAPLGDDIKDMNFIENNFNRLSVAKLTEIKDNVRIIEYDSADRGRIRDRLRDDDVAVEICSREISDSFINRTLNNDDMDGFIASYNNIDFGFVFYNFQEDNRGEFVEVKLLCVKRPPDALRGIPFGKIIMAMVEEAVKDVNDEVGRIFLEAVRDAVPFYESIGFTILDDSGLVDMEKIINPDKVKNRAVIRGEDLDIDVDDIFDIEMTAEEIAEQKALKKKIKAFMRNKNQGK